MDKPSMPKAFSTHHYWYSSLLNSATSAEAKLIYTYDHAFHGFNTVLSTDELRALKKSEGMVSASVSKAVTFDTTHSVNFLGLSTATGLCPAPHYGKDGVAPRARIAAYKTGSNDTETLACIDQAVADGVHIISISLRYEAASLFYNPIATATFGAREKGIVVCKSAGNTGYNIATIRNGIPWEFVVASGTIDRWFAGTITLGNGKTITGFTMFPLRASVINLSLIFNQTLSVCNSTEVLSQSNLRRIVVCTVNTSLLRPTYFPFPGNVISREQAVELIEYATTSASPTATIDFQQTITGPNLPRGVAAPALSGSSSRGPSQTYQEILKPDIMVLGVLILAAYSPICPGPQVGDNFFLSTDYALVSGTSMAAPHISGPIKQAGFNPHSVASPLGIGSGQVDLNRALDPDSGIIRSSYNCSSPSPDLNYPLFIALYNFDQSGVTLTKRYEKQSYSLSIRYIEDIETGVRHGSLTWIEETGKYVVRSPIVISGGVDNYG
ncbi:hypothetical protein SASPL_157417 [Salvia splendens]|uniref:Uncharacterized protein n=1 Tax=Salvia splendens TaxID=180675 RepID=A0A8X8VUY9_SALSN|nr:hypothetical protein SASPL_157417 [Salvia splendens]